MSTVVLVHGGAGTVDAALREAARAGVEAAAAAGRRALRDGADAEAAAVAAVRVLEDDPTFNAGRGACMTSEGTFETDASIMLGDGRVGAVGAVSDLADAIVVARKVLHESRHVLLVGAGAAAFARAHGVGTFDRAALLTDKAQARYEAATAGHSSIDGQADTVGAIVRDAAGNLAVACSTGGVLLKTPGRVGDTPLVGAGLFADESGAACATGVGEAIIGRVASYEVLRRVARGQSPDEAAADVCREAAGRDATCGLILVLADGRVGLAHHSPHMSWALARGDARIEAAIEVGPRGPA